MKLALIGTGKIIEDALFATFLRCFVQLRIAKVNVN